MQIGPIPSEPPCKSKRGQREYLHRQHRLCFWGRTSFYSVLDCVDQHWKRKKQKHLERKKGLAWFIESTFNMSAAPSDIAGKPKKACQGM